MRMVQYECTVLSRQSNILLIPGLDELQLLFESLFQLLASTNRVVVPRLQLFKYNKIGRSFVRTNPPRVSLPVTVVLDCASMNKGR